MLAASWAFWANSTAPACFIADMPTVHARTLGEAIDRWDIVRGHDVKVHEFFRLRRVVSRRRLRSLRIGGSTNST